MNIPGDLKYTKSHEWVRFLDDNRIQIGISDFAQEALGDIVFINLPQEGDEAVLDDPICDFESVKAVEDILSPASGEICAVNELLADTPELINNDPYGAWIVEICSISEIADLLDAAEYKKHCDDEGV